MINNAIKNILIIITLISVPGCCRIVYDYRDTESNSYTKVISEPNIESSLYYMVKDVDAEDGYFKDNYYTAIYFESKSKLLIKKIKYLVEDEKSNSIICKGVLLSGAIRDGYYSNENFISMVDFELDGQDSCISFLWGRVDVDEIQLKITFIYSIDGVEKELFVDKKLKRHCSIEQTILR
jgi:hypothetical protein